MKQDGKFILMTREELPAYLDSIKNAKKFTTIQQHHTASPSYKSVKNGNEIALMKDMEHYHMTNPQMKMSEIAQHFSTFPDGKICVGRPLTKDGGGFLGDQNDNSITIENVGNFDVDNMTEEQKQSIILLNALLCKKFNITPSTSTLIYHCWVKNKSCPGAKWFGGTTKAAAEKNFIPLIKAAMNPPAPKPEPIPDIFKDMNEISSYAKEAVKALYNAGIVGGDNEGNFNPKNPLTRQDAAVIIYNVLKKINEGSIKL